MTKIELRRWMRELGAEQAARELHDEYVRAFPGVKLDMAIELPVIKITQVKVRGSKATITKRRG